MVHELPIWEDGVAARIVEIQRAAYAVEAALMGFDGIPPLHETVADVRGLTDLTWLGASDGGTLVGIIAWRQDGDLLDVDRLAVDPSHARRGYGRRLLEALPECSRTVVSTGAANTPGRALYEGLGFVCTAESEIAPGVRLAHYERARPAGGGGGPVASGMPTRGDLDR